MTGATGLVGGALAASLRADGVRVLTIGRGRTANIPWDPSAGLLDATRLEGIDGVVNLAGEPIAARWTSARKRAIHDSRVQGTSLIVRAMRSLKRRPTVLVNGSAVGFYGDCGDRVLTEQSPAGTDFLAGVVRDWEAAAATAAPAIRVCTVRTGIVLSPAGGALARMLPLFRLGLGGPMGDGQQWMAWIGLHDLVRAIRFVLEHDMHGAVNGTAPNPVTNAEFARTFGQVISRPARVPAPAFALRALLGEMATGTALASQRALPARLDDAGFTFDAPKLEGALRRELASRPR